MNTTFGAEQFDVVIVGSGAGGSAAAYRLVRAGLRVAVVEKGERLPRDGSTLDVQAVVHDGVFKSQERWADGSGRELRPEEHFNVGGKTKWYGAALARFAPAEFVAELDYQCPAWPFSYDEMRTYYEQAELLLGVREFATESDLVSLVDRLQARAPGWRRVALPLALKSQIVSTPAEAAHFDGFASPTALKADAENAFLARVAEAPNLTLLTGSTVASLVGSGPRIEGVRLDNGTVLYASEVVLAAGALHSPRLLTRYLEAERLTSLPVASSVGRNLKLHLLTAVLAISHARIDDLLRKTILMLHEQLPHSSVQPLGFDGELIATLIPRYVPRSVARALGARAYGFFLQTEDGSSDANRVLAEGSQCEYPVLDYDAMRTPEAAREHRELVGTFCRDLRRAGYVALSRRIGLDGTAHACGTLRAGTDPRNSVVDATGRVHGFEGLSVADGSVLPRSSRVNPALTIYAWGLRLADLLAGRESTTTFQGFANARQTAVAAQELYR